MPFKLSNCVAIHTPQQEQAVEFYTNVLGLPNKGKAGSTIEFSDGRIRLFVDQDPNIEAVFELLVPDLEQARDELIAQGCEVIRWNGRGQDCYIRDPFGTMFNLWEDPTAFESE
jgi:catechol 2,3-dioxygenase-like lactoylglutathione lyase family enzyme